MIAATYCNKPTVRGSRLILPDHSFKLSKWHNDCVVRFIVDNGDKCEDIDRLMDEPGGISIVVGTILKKVNTEEQYRRRNKLMELTV